MPLTRLTLLYSRRENGTQLGLSAVKKKNTWQGIPLPLWYLPESIGPFHMRFCIFKKGLQPRHHFLQAGTAVPFLLEERSAQLTQRLSSYLHISTIRKYHQESRRNNPLNRLPHKIRRQLLLNWTIARPAGQQWLAWLLWEVSKQ